MDGVSCAFVKNFGVNIVNKLFFIFCVPQFKDTESNWLRREGVDPVTTHSGLTTALPVDLDASIEEDCCTTIKSESESISTAEEENAAEMAEGPDLASEAVGDKSPAEPRRGSPRK